MAGSFLAARRSPTRNASMTSANRCGVPRELPNRIRVVACAGCFRRRDLAASRPPPSISAMAPRIGLSASHERAAECRNQGLQATVARHGIAPVEELTRLAASWEEWGRDPGAFFAFPWCRVLAWA